MGTVDVTLQVVDAEIAKKTIADKLKGTEFSNYKEILVYGSET